MEYILLFSRIRQIAFKETQIKNSDNKCRSSQHFSSNPSEQKFFNPNNVECISWTSVSKKIKQLCSPTNGRRDVLDWALFNMQKLTVIKKFKIKHLGRGRRTEPTEDEVKAWKRVTSSSCSLMAIETPEINIFPFLKISVFFTWWVAFDSHTIELLRMNFHSQILKYKSAWFFLH